MIWVHVTLIVQNREGQLLRPRSLACLTSFSTCTWERWRASSQAICPTWVLVSGSPGALLRRGPLRTVRAGRPGTRLKQPAWAVRHVPLVGVVRSDAWVTSRAVGVDEAVDRRPAAGLGDGLVGQRRADAPVPGLPLGAGVGRVVHGQQGLGAQRAASVLGAQGALPRRR